MSVIKAACIQMTSTPDMAGNLDAAEALVREAAAGGAQFIATPENTDRMSNPEAAKAYSGFSQEEHPGIPKFSALAAELRIWLLVGSMAVKVSAGKSANRSFLFSPEGKIAASYDKIHLFDVNLPTGEMHRESDRIANGDKVVINDICEGAKLGLSICYDVRFAYLYRALAQAGADILAVPAAFTVPTGRAHWEVLLRARAIETGSFVIAPAQVGEHDEVRRTWGHSMIISPWGEILAQAGGEKPEIITAELHLSHVRKARTAIPALTHDRDVKF